MQPIIVKTLGRIGILVLLPTLGFGDELWNRAVKIAESYSSIYPGKIVEHERVYDTKGIHQIGIHLAGRF